MNEKAIDRLGIFFFYDAEGIVDDYVIYMLEAYAKHFTSILTVVNGKLTEDSKKRLLSIDNNEVLIRDNKGFDVWAYRTGIYHFGWDRIRRADELIMFNFTICGPVNGDSFDLMFADMDNKDLDFWGMTIHNGAPFDPWGIMEDGYIPVHIQSHFIAVRNKMLNSEEYYLYWKNRPMITRYEEAVGLHEAIFTGRFADLGYKWDVYVNTWDLMDKTFYPLFNMPVELIRERNCPIFKRKLFIQEYGDAIQENAFEKAGELRNYLINDTEYDFSMIEKHLMRTSALSKYSNCTNLNAIITEVNEGQNVNCACIITDEKEKNKPSDWDELEKSFKQVYAIGNKSVELCKLLISLSEAEYDYILFIDAASRPSGEEFYIDTVYSSRDKLIDDSMIKSEAYIKGIKCEFENKKSLGMIVPPSSLHGGYFDEIGIVNKEYDNPKVKRFIERSIKFWKKEAECILKKQEAFWIKAEALKSIVPFIDEIIKENLCKYITSILPLLLHENGYYTAWATSADSAKNLLNSMYNKIFSEKQLYSNSNRWEKELEDKNLEFKVTMYGTDEDVSSENRVFKYHFEEDSIRATIFIPEGVRSVLFEPVECDSCIIKELMVDEELIVRPNNGIRIGEEDYFIGGNPQYVIEGLSDKNSLTIKIKNIESLSGERLSRANALFAKKPSLMQDLNILLNKVSSYELHFDFGNGFSIKDELIGKYDDEEEDYVAEFSVPNGTKTIRFDPVEHMACVIRDISLNGNGNQHIIPLNGVRTDEGDLFMNDDPQYLIQSDGFEYGRVKVEFKEITPIILER